MKLKADTIDSIIGFWSSQLGIPASRLTRVYFKKNKVNTKRRNVGLLYNGLVRVNMAHSSSLVRKIEGWVRGIDNNCQVV